MVAEKKVRKTWEEGPVSGFRNNHIGAVRLCVRVFLLCVCFLCVGHICGRVPVRLVDVGFLP